MASAITRTIAGRGAFQEQVSVLLPAANLSQAGYIRLTSTGAFAATTPVYAANVRNGASAQYSRVDDQFVASKQYSRAPIPELSPDLKNRLSEVRWPAHYLDFETMMTAVPLYPDIAPYTQVPTQYSIHTCSSIGKVQSHKEYLADPRRDSRRDLAQALIADLDGAGSIVTYSQFEKRIINDLGCLFPDLTVELDAIGQRMFDLEAVIRDNYYHPAFHGGTSVKVTLPALVDMSYNALNIRDGGSASATFAYAAMGRYQIESVKEDLLAYCAQDTLAMVRLHETIHEQVEKHVYVSI